VSGGGEEQRASVISLFVMTEKTFPSNGELMINLVIAVLLRLTSRMGEETGKGMEELSGDTRCWGCYNVQWRLEMVA
jgi:hypothetical protein